MYCLYSVNAGTADLQYAKDFMHMSCCYMHNCQAFVCACQSESRL